MAIHGDSPVCNCFIENRDKLTDTLHVYQAADLLSPAMTCHEAVASFYELLLFRRAILNGKSKEYLKSKPLLAGPLKQLLKIDLAQDKLSLTIK